MRQLVAPDNSADDPKTSIIHAPMIGSVTNQSAKNWCCAANEGMVELRFWAEVTTDSSVGQPLQMAKASQDYTTVFQLDQLPNTPY
ncbi:hypothetical protein CMK14_20910 [Candidatus Poribacteria bacterium]|nr:hypothetical protein [Candidatus Poribacteria bacterium]